MGKRSRQAEDKDEGASSGKNHSKKSVLSDNSAVDPSLALLFASSVSPLRKQLRPFAANF